MACQREKATEWLTKHYKNDEIWSIGDFCFIVIQQHTHQYAVKIIRRDWFEFSTDDGFWLKNHAGETQWDTESGCAWMILQFLEDQENKL